MTSPESYFREIEWDKILREADIHMEKETKNKAVKPPLTDSEGNRVVSAKDETVKEEPSLNKAAKKAIEDEAAAEAAAAKASAEADDANAKAWQEFLDNR